MNSAIPGLDRHTTISLFASAGVLLAWSFVCSLIKAGPLSASLITYPLYIFYVWYAVHYKNPLIQRLVLIGTIAGFLELYTDHYLVNTINSLVYPSNELMLWSSPAYMPFAWSNVLVQLSFIGVLLTKRFGWVVASILLCIMGGMYIPVYEHLANDAGWWWYNNNTRMIFNAPLYIILSEALISLSLPYLSLFAENKKLGSTLALGIVEGVWIFLSVFIGYTLLH